MSLSGDTRRPARRRPMADINVVPYIDVTLVLLIIFMITAPMLETGVDVELPQAEAKTLNPDEQLPIIITINADGALFLDAGNQADAPVTDAELVSRVQAALEKKPGLAVLMAGLPSVGLMTQPAIE